MHDMIIRHATVIDGTGADRRLADIAITGGIITAVGEVNGPASREIDATGLIVTPGFVDIHTHYDGQATWDGEMAPSSWHGVTTAVMGNCGVGFAPVRVDRHDWLIGLMEGVEDIPGTALHEGLTWEWETFPEYMAALDRLPRTIDIAAQVPHGAVRAYVMGERGAANEPATSDDIAQMKQIVLDGLKAGAVGFSTSRMMLHLSRDGVPVPGTFANEDEILGIGEALGEAGHGVFELASDLTPAASELDWMVRLSEANDAPVVYSLAQFHSDPESWRAMVEANEQANHKGAKVYAGVSSRGLGGLLTWDSTLHPFVFCPSFHALIPLSQDDRLAALRDPGLRETLIAEAPVFSEQFEGDENLLSRREIMEGTVFNYKNMFCMESEGGIDYEPSADKSVAAIAEREGKNPRAVIYDLMSANEGKGTLYYPGVNFAYGNYDHILDMFESPAAVLSLSDAGAHVGILCDGSQPTFMLTHWVRDRKRGGRLSLERAVQLQSSVPASIYGFDDRGTLEPGKRADLNIIDWDKLAVGHPVMHFDLPTNAKRFLQQPEGYVATIVAGQIVRENGHDTGARPGRLVRGGRQHSTPSRQAKNVSDKNIADPAPTEAVGSRSVCIGAREDFRHLGS